MKGIEWQIHLHTCMFICRCAEYWRCAQITFFHPHGTGFCWVRWGATNWSEICGVTVAVCQRITSYHLPLLLANVKNSDSSKPFLSTMRSPVNSTDPNGRRLGMAWLHRGQAVYFTQQNQSTGLSQDRWLTVDTSILQCLVIPAINPEKFHANVIECPKNT